MPSLRRLGKKPCTNPRRLVKVSKGWMSTQLNVAQIPREFVRCWGDHDRIPKAIYLRLASLIAVAKSLARSDELADELRARAQQEEEGQWGDEPPRLSWRLFGLSHTISATACDVCSVSWR
jgi:hypothetical protein